MILTFDLASDLDLVMVVYDFDLGNVTYHVCNIPMTFHQFIDKNEKVIKNKVFFQCFLYIGGHLGGHLGFGNVPTLCAKTNVGSENFRPRPTRWYMNLLVPRLRPVDHPKWAFVCSTKPGNTKLANCLLYTLKFSITLVNRVKLPFSLVTCCKHPEEKLHALCCQAIYVLPPRVPFR